MLALRRNKNLSQTLFKTGQVRSFWEYVNMMFNKPDPDRIRLVGPDRACAEWVLRNGGAVSWEDGKRLKDYNLLPSDSSPVPKLLEIDGSNSSISHYGFPHLSGCAKLQRILLHNCSYIDNRAMTGLSYGKNTLTHVQISKCLDITDEGIKELKSLSNLQNLVLFNLGSVKNLEECKQFLQSHLVKCKIEGDTEKMSNQSS